MKYLLSAVLVFILMMGCSDSGDSMGPGGNGNENGNGNGNGNGNETTVSFADEVQPIFNANCAVPACHTGTSPTGNLSLDEESGYGNLVNVTSTGSAPTVRVAPAEPDSSVLYQKLIGNPDFGQQMPLGGQLGEDEIETIRTWIEEGANEN